MDTLDAQLNAVKVEDVNHGTVQLLNFAAAFWDTFGWIKFKQSDFSTAEKYLSAASDLSDDPNIRLHMGKLEEAQGHKKEAIRCYVAALRSAPALRGSEKAEPGPERSLSAGEQEARERLVALAGSEQAANEQLQEAPREGGPNRTVTIPFSEKTDLSERFAAIITPGPKIASSGALPGAKERPKLLARFATKIPPQSFPNPSVTSIPRIAIIRCVASRAECELEFLPNETATEALSEEPSPE